MAHAPKEPKDKDDMSPPREGWERPPEIMGYVPVEDFRRAKQGSRKVGGWKVLGGTSVEPMMLSLHLISNACIG